MDSQSCDNFVESLKLSAFDSIGVENAITGGQLIRESSVTLLYFGDFNTVGRNMNDDKRAKAFFRSNDIYKINSIYLSTRPDIFHCQSTVQSLGFDYFLEFSSPTLQQLSLQLPAPPYCVVLNQESVVCWQGTRFPTYSNKRLKEMVSRKRHFMKRKKKQQGWRRECLLRRWMKKRCGCCVRKKVVLPVFPSSLETNCYPTARRDDGVVDDFHGNKIVDAYRWMEDPDSAETKEWVKQLNSISEPFLAAAASREILRKRLTDLWDFEKFSCTSKRGKYYYYSYNTGLQNQYVIYQQKSLEDKGTVFLDPNSLSSDGTTAIRMSSWSKDGSIYAYGLSEKGSDGVTVKFKTCDGVDMSDVIKRVKFSSLSWMADKSGVFYCKYPDHKSASEGTSVEKHKFHSLYFHKMGTDCKEDVLVYDDREHPDYMMGGSVSLDGRFLIIDVSRGCDPFNLIYYVDLEKNGPVTGRLNVKPLFDKLDAKYDYVDHDGDTMLFHVNKDAPMFRLIRVDINDPSTITTVVPEDAKCKLEWATPIAGNKLVMKYSEDVKSAIYVHDLSTGKRLYRIPLDIGSVDGFWGRKDDDEMFFTFASHLVPTVVYRTSFTNLPLETAPKITELRRVTPNGINVDEFEVKQVFYPSKDGTKIPMFIISKKGIELDGTHPTLLNGYGGFNVSDLPYFSVTRLLFVKHFGGVIACSNLRGGGEYGEKWHEGGMKKNKQNVFDDFIAAGEWLIDNKYTNKKKLSIMGGLNGGLLMGAVSQQRPDLFGAVVNRVGVLDMLRFHKFTVGGAWVPEYGNPDVKEEFEYIIKYSPLHNIRFPSSSQWPSTLLMTADHDDRVVPSHTLKYIAELYHKCKEHADQKNPLIARIEVKAGHGKPTSKIIAENVDLYCFLQRTLDMEWKE